MRHCVHKLNVCILALLPMKYFPKRDVSVCEEMDMGRNVHNHIIYNIPTLEKSKWLSILEGRSKLCIHIMED